MPSKRKSDLTIEDLMDIKGDLETLDANALDKLVQELIDLKQTAHEQEEQISRLQAESMTDTLTGAVTKRVLEQELGRSLSLSRRYGRRNALIMIDLDDFKSINTHFSRAVGDKVLANVASLLKQNIRPTDVVARYGDDEFAVILNEVRTLDDAVARADDFQQILCDTPCIVEGRSVCISARVGFCYFGAEYDIQGILETAEQDMRRRRSKD